MKLWNIEINMLNESRINDDYIVREMLMTNLEDGQQRRLIHMHYTGWPDFGVPERPASLVQLVRAFRQRVPAVKANTTRPTVVHCRLAAPPGCSVL